MLDPFKAHYYDSPIRVKVAELLKILPKWHGLSHAHGDYIMMFLQLKMVPQEHFPGRIIFPRR